MSARIAAKYWGDVMEQTLPFDVARCRPFIKDDGGHEKCKNCMRFALQPWQTFERPWLVKPMFSINPFDGCCTQQIPVSEGGAK
jgi:hypothetical protein